MRIFTFLFLLSMSTLVSAQALTAIHTFWDTDFTQWSILTNDEDIAGELVMRWKNPVNWQAWDVHLGNLPGSIEVKWRADVNEWEIRYDRQIVTARTVWKNKFDAWRITNNDQVLTWESRWDGDQNNWLLRDQPYSGFEMFTNWDGDPREWTIRDEMGEEFPMAMKMAMVFVAVYLGIPK